MPSLQGLRMEQAGGTQDGRHGGKGTKSKRGLSVRVWVPGWGSSLGRGGN